MRLTWLTGHHRSTIWKVLKRHGVSRQRRSQRPQTTRRYEWTEAGALLHIDAFELPKFEVVGHWAHGDRAQVHRTRHAGKVKVIGVIDDHTRLAYCEIHGAENKHTVSATLARISLTPSTPHPPHDSPPYPPPTNRIQPDTTYLSTRHLTRLHFSSTPHPTPHADPITPYLTRHLAARTAFHGRFMKAP